MEEEVVPKLFRGFVFSVTANDEKAPNSIGNGTGLPALEVSESSS